MKKNASIDRVLKIIESYGKDYDAQRKALKKLIKEGKETGDGLLLGAAYRQFAVIGARTGELDSVLPYALKALALLKDCGDPEIVSKAYNTLGYAYAYSALENNQMALACYEKSYRIIKRHRIMNHDAIYAVNNLAACYHTMGNYKASAKLFSECLELARIHSMDDYSDLAMYTVNLAKSYERLGALEQAVQVLDSIAEFVEKVDFKALACDYYLCRASIAYRFGDREAGGRFVDGAIANVGGAAPFRELYEDFGKILRFLVASNDRERADKIMELMQAYSEKRTDTMDQLIVCRTRSDYYAGFGEPARALASFKQLDELYEKHLLELKSVQLSIHEIITSADAEIHKLSKKIRENEEDLAREPLTKLLNRTALLKISSEFIELAAKRRVKVGAIFIDIDFFKECNDTYGHARGDEIIREVGEVCRREDSPNVRFARYGGDEFFGLTLGLKDDEVVEIARRICTSIRKANIPNEKNPNGHRVTLSAGVVNVAISERANTIIDIANYADKALYHAKSGGRNAIFLLDYIHAEGDENEASFVNIDF